MCAVGGSYTFVSADKEVLKCNGFSFEPLHEVCLIFIGIFGTMIPALEIIGRLAQSEWGKHFIASTTLYWGTGFFSSVLDNAPTYLKICSCWYGFTRGKYRITSPCTGLCSRRNLSKLCYWI